MFKIIEGTGSNQVTAYYEDPSSNQKTAEITGTLEGTVLTLETWNHLNLKTLRSLIRKLSTVYQLRVQSGRYHHQFFPSLGFELIDKNNDLWQFPE